MINSLIIAAAFSPILIYFIAMRDYKFKIKTMIVISMFGAISYILSMIPLIKYPQEGGIYLFSMLPVMLIGILYGRRSGITCGLIYGILQLIGPSMLIHPAQILLDYILSSMALGLSDIFGTEKKLNIFYGSVLAVVLSCMCQVLSGYIFFADYAPIGENAFIYSLVYNFSGKGVEGLLSAMLLMIIPIKRIKKAAW